MLYVSRLLLHSAIVTIVSVRTANAIKHHARYSPYSAGLYLILTLIFHRPKSRHFFVSLPFRMQRKAVHEKSKAFVDPMKGDRVVVLVTCRLSSHSTVEMETFVVGV